MFNEFGQHQSIRRIKCEKMKMSRIGIQTSTFGLTFSADQKTNYFGLHIVVQHHHQAKRKVADHLKQRKDTKHRTVLKSDC